jgi:3-methyladenine DNA glycosylase AlkD
MPVLREYVKAHREALTPARQKKLLMSPYHEERMVALLVWVYESEKCTDSGQDKIARAFLKAKDHANNWDLIDVSVPDLLGPSLHRRAPFMVAAFNKLLRSKKLWDRRIAILSTFHSIRKDDFDYVLFACASVLEDQEDLIHKASGWMLRETGKRSPTALRGFLREHSGPMPRTMLRYAIERLPETERKRWLNAPVRLQSSPGFGTKLT